MTRKNKYRFCAARADVTNYAEHDCMNPRCMYSWDVHNSEGPMELCPKCRSNDIHRRPAMDNRHVHADHDDRYQGADIFDQYGRY